MRQRIEIVVTCEVGDLYEAEICAETVASVILQQLRPRQGVLEALRDVVTIETERDVAGPNRAARQPRPGPGKIVVIPEP